MVEILSDRALYDRLLHQPEDRAAAVEEALRKYSAVPLQPRYTESAVTIAGVDIPADSWLLYGAGPANHDPDVFHQPDAFLIDRGANRHITFGRGPHFCLGSHLAREELRVSLSLLLDRLPGLRLAEGGEAKIVGSPLRGVHRLSVMADDVLAPVAYTPPKRASEAA
jgi:cytochrome P450